MGYYTTEKGEEGRAGLRVEAGRGRAHGAGAYLGDDIVLVTGGEAVGDSNEQSLASADLLHLPTGTLTAT